MSVHTRGLAQVLISKLGGNVDHDIISSLCEYIDNSLDANSKKIFIKTFKINNKFYFCIFDNGLGVKNLKNMLCAQEGKIDQLGCKNQGFLDALVYFCNLRGNHEIFTKYKDKYSKVEIKFDDFYNNYKTQLNSNENIDFNKLQQILEDNIDYLKHDNTERLIGEEEKNFIQENGTVIKIEINESIFNEINLIDPSVFQLRYSSFNDVNLVLNNKEINIIPEKNICLTDKYQPAIFSMWCSKHTNNNEIYKMTNNFERDEQFFKKTKIFSNINKNNYEKLLETYNEEILFSEIHYTCITEKEAIEQQRILGEESIENLRCIFIEFKGKLLGPFKFPKDVKGFASRNMINGRILLKIHNENILKDIIMSNKSKTNIDNISKCIIKFINYAKLDINITYLDNINRANPNISDLKEYFRKKHSPSPPQSPPPQSPPPQSPPPQSPPPQSPTLTPSLSLKKKKKKNTSHKSSVTPSPPLPAIQSIKWKCSVYFGVSKCDRYKGIILNNDGMIECHFGITEDDPKHRDAGNGLGPTWRRFITVNLDETGSKTSEGKRMIEWKIEESINKLNLGDKIEWQRQSHEYFNCKPEVFQTIYKTVRETMFKYELPLLNN